MKINNIQVVLILVKENIKNICKRWLFLLFISFVIFFDTFGVLFLKNTTLECLSILSKYFYVNKPLLLKLSFIYIFYIIFIFTYTFLFIDIPLETFSKEIHEKEIETWIVNTGRKFYFISKIITFLIFLYLLVFLHCILIYLVFYNLSDILKINIIQMFILSIELFSSSLTVFTIALFLDTIIRRTTLIPPLLGSLLFLSGCLFLFQISCSFAEFLNTDSLLKVKSNLSNLELSKKVQNFVEGFSKLSEYTDIAYFRLKPLEIALYPFFNYFKISFFYVSTTVFNEKDIEFLFNVKLSLWEKLFPILFFFIGISLLYLYFFNKDF